MAVVASEPNYAKFQGNDFNLTAVAGLSPVEADRFFSWFCLLIKCVVDCCKTLLLFVSESFGS